MKKTLSLMLFVYSLAALAYSASEVFKSRACVHCIKHEVAFKGGAGSQGDKDRVVHIKLATAGYGAFPPDKVDKMSGAIRKANKAWAEAMGSADKNTEQPTKIPFRFEHDQADKSVKTNITVLAVDKVPSRDQKAPFRGSTHACMGLAVDYVEIDNKTRQIIGGTIYVRKELLDKLTEDELAGTFQHEEGHFMGLKDNFKDKTCSSIMSQAEDGCKPISKEISKNDVDKINTYVYKNKDCFYERTDKVLPIEDVDGGSTFIDPQPVTLYPRTCFQHYDAVPVYYCYDGCRLIGHVYRLIDSVCY